MVHKKPWSHRDGEAVIWTIAILLAGTVIGTGIAHAGALEDCNQVRDLNRQVRGCSALIEQGAAAPESLAIAYLNRANVYAQRGKHASALADYTSALLLDPSNPFLLYNRGNLYLDMRRYETAVADYSKAIALDQGFAFAYLNRGIAHEFLGDTSAAADDYRQALAIDPSLQAAQRRLKSLQSQ